MLSSGSLKSLRSLWAILAQNQRYSEFVTLKDCQTFHERTEHEGLSFLTTALPSIGKALDQFHATQAWEPPTRYFKCDEDGLPLFLGKAVKFALKGCSLAVDCVRQLSYVFYKLELEYDKEVVDRFINSFIATDALVGDCDLGANIGVKDHITLMKRIIWRILCNYNPLDIRPCHGSGATACRTANEDKWHKLRYYPKLDRVYSYSDYFFYSLTHLCDEYSKLEDSVNSDPYARVVLVPKDARGPRIISCEPAELMYIQQGLMRKLYEILESHPLTKGYINFTDQTINRNLARSSSTDGKYCTIDLSDASDRVSLELVRQVFPANWFEGLDACRSEFTRLPDGRMVKLNKFAPMGSACCFPVEALVFWASCQATFQRLRLKSEAFVYGDDIMVESFLGTHVMQDLELIGLLVNKHKSFTRGFFRESCGGDYYNSYDVTPVRVRKFLGQSRTSIARDADLANNFIAKFGEEAALPIVKLIDRENGYIFPRTLLDLPGTIRLNACDSNDVHFKKRWNKSLQRFEHRVLVLNTRALARRESAWSELLRKELTSRSRDAEPNFRSNGPVVLRPQTSIEPGMYADTHSARRKWAWVWLG